MTPLYYVFPGNFWPNYLPDRSFPGLTVVLLVVEDASHTLASDEPTLTIRLGVANASHIIRSDRRTLVVNLIVADASSTSDSDEVTTTSNYTAIADDSSHSSASDNTPLSHKYAGIFPDGIHSLYSYIQIFPLIYFQKRDTILYYFNRGKVDYTINQLYSDVLETETGATITTEDSDDIDIDYYKDVLTYPIMLNYQQRDFTISEN